MAQGPLVISMILSARCMASATSWVILISVWPVSRQMRRASSCKAPDVSASSAEKGSSMSGILGWTERARDAHALAHPARELRRALHLGAMQAHQINGALGALQHLSA